MCEQRSCNETKMFKQNCLLFKFEQKSCLETKRSEWKYFFETTIFAKKNLAFNPSLDKSLARKPKISAAERSFFETKMFEQKKTCF